MEPEGTFQANWDSLAQHESPAWFNDAKLDMTTDPYGLGKPFYYQDEGDLTATALSCPSSASRSASSTRTLTRACSAAAPAS